MPEPRLITIPLSPFNELARWSLDHAGVAYDEEPNGLLFHVIASRRAGGKGTTPVLVADGEVIGESAEIAEWADRIRVLASDVDVFAYFNNDWEGFAVANGLKLRRLLKV